MVSSADELRILSWIPGRMRVHFSGWEANEAESIEKRLGQIQGIECVRANPNTGNVLILFDRRAFADQSLLSQLHTTWISCQESGKRGSPHASPLPPHSTMLRVGLRGLLGHAAIDSVWFGVGLFGKFVGLPFSWLGPLHVLMDVAVWTYAIVSGVRSAHGPNPRSPQR